MGKDLSVPHWQARILVRHPLLGFPGSMFPKVERLAAGSCAHPHPEVPGRWGRRNAPRGTRTGERRPLPRAAAHALRARALGAGAFTSSLAPEKARGPFPCAARINDQTRDDIAFSTGER